MLFQSALFSGSAGGIDLPPRLERSANHRSGRIAGNRRQTRILRNQRRNNRPIYDYGKFVCGLFRIRQLRMPGHIGNPLQHDCLVSNRNIAQFVVELVVLRHGVDERTTVILPAGKPIFQQCEDVQQPGHRIALESIQPLEQPLPSFPPFAVEDLTGQSFLGAERIVQRRLRCACFGNNSVDADGVNTVAAEQMRCRLKQALSRRRRTALDLFLRFSSHLFNLHLGYVKADAVGQG